MADYAGTLKFAVSFDDKELRQGIKNFVGDSSKVAQQSASIWGKVKDNIIANVVNKGFDLATSAIKDFSSSVVTTGMNFEKSMSEVASITGATGDDLALLEKTARDFGSSTVFSASEAAQALKYMGLAGWDANQSASALGGVLDLAAASGMELAQASDMVTDYLSAFGMEASQSAYFADMLTYAQNNSNTTAEALGEAYKNCAANLNAAGQDVETTTSLLAMMANQGLKGSEAGTALNAVMRDMTAKMENGAIAIGDASVQVMDANGNYRDMTDILRDVESATNGMGDAEKAAALSSTFTSDSIKGLNLILNAGVDQASAFEESLRNADGTAKSTADTMNDNLAGKMAGLNSKMEELQIKLYDAIQPALSGATDIASGFADAIGWVIDNANWLLPILGTLTASVTAYQIATNLAAIKEGILTTATTIMTGAQTALNTVMNLNPIGLIIAAVVALVAGFVLLWNKCEGFRNFIMGAVEAVGNAIGAVGAFIGGIFSKIGEIATTVFQTIWNFIQPIINLLVQAFQNWWTVVSTIFTAVWNIVQTVFTIVWSIVSTVINNIVTIFQNLWIIVSAIFGWVWETVNSVFTQIWETVSGIINNIIMAFQSAWDFIAGIFGNVAGWFSARFTEAYNAIVGIFSGIASFFSGIWNQIVGIFSTIGARVGEVVSGAFKGVVNGVLSTVENILNGPIRAINGLIDVINNVPGVELGHLDEFNLPRMEYGGIIPGTSYSGDHNLIRANSGEMVLTRSQQAGLWDFIQNSFGTSEDEGSPVGSVSEPVTINQTNYFEKDLTAEQIEELMSKSIRRAVA